MKFREMIEGLQILARYADKGLDAHLNGADHDVIWAADRDKEISDEDKQRLGELGWFVSPYTAETWTHYC